MMDDLYLGYVLDALDPAEAAAVEAHLRTHPDEAAKLDQLRRVLRPLEADRGDIDPPPGLAIAALARVAEAVVAARQADAAADTPVEEIPAVSTAIPEDYSTRPRPAEAPGRLPLRRWVEVGVAAGIGFLAVGMGLAGVQNLRWNSQRAACENNLRVLYQGANGYADTRDGKFPQVGGERAPTAGAFVAVLVAANHYPAELKLYCPAAGDVPPELAGFHPDPHTLPGPAVYRQVGYAYTLGYRGPTGLLVGVRRTDADGNTPLAADLPAPAVAPSAGPVSPHGRGQNVLYADGRVWFCTTATVGPFGDDIYRNMHNLVQAGLAPTDASLGRAADVP